MGNIRVILLPVIIPHVSNFVPLWVQKDSPLGTLNSDVDHCNTHMRAENRLVLHALIADCSSEVVELISSTKRRA